MTGSEIVNDIRETEQRRSGFAKRILVAGGAGFIGSHLCKRLLDEGCDVVAVDNLVSGSLKNIGQALNRGLTFIDHDIKDPLPASLELQFDEIYNLASPASPDQFAEMPRFILETAFTGHRNLLELASACGARILFASTSEVYGCATQHPQSETYFGNVNPVGPRGCYDEGKRCAEALSMAYNRELGTDIRIARIFNTYGPGMPDDGRVIWTFLRQAFKRQPLSLCGDGTQTRSFCFVSDLVDGLCRLMASEVRQPVNLGNPNEITVFELAERVNRLTGNHAGTRLIPQRGDDPVKRRPDISLAESFLGWSPQVGLNEGLARTIEHFDEVNLGLAEAAV